MKATTTLSRRPRFRAAALVVLGLALPLTLAACSSGGDDAPAGDDTAAWEPTKNIDWIVPYSAGGGYDIYSRGVAKVMQETQLPDGVNVLIRNTPPLPQGITEEFNAKPDGYTVGILPMPAAAAQEIQTPELAKWKTDEFTVLGSVDENAYVVYVAADSKYKSIEDLEAAKGLKSVTVEEGSSSALAGQVTIQGLDLDATVTYGAEGSSEVVTALLRGDADFIVYGSTDLTGFVESGDIKPVLFLGTDEQRPESLEWLKDVPSASDAGFPDIAGTVTELRLIVAPPGLPDNVATYLRDAVDKTLKSDEFAQWAKDSERPFVPRDWEGATEAANAQIKAMQTLIPQLAK